LAESPQELKYPMKMWCVVFPVPGPDSRTDAELLQGIINNGIGSVLKEVEITAEDISLVADRIVKAEKHGTIVHIKPNRVVEE
jgi:hypothetical protein